jgi:3-hydroxyanthranilate 3,4-dioxygenase
VAEVLKPFNLMGWIEENRPQFNKPVGNHVMWKEGTEFIAFCSGANARNDFHINPGDEIFFQIQGDIRVDLILDGKRVVNEVREGEILLVPSWVPHAPRRPEGTWGLVVERHRAPNELDSFVWFCENCANKLHEVQFHLKDIEGQVERVLTDVNDDEALRTCDSCGTVLPVYSEFHMSDP